MSTTPPRALAKMRHNAIPPAPGQTRGASMMDEKGMRAAEAFARWHLGDRGWAGLIINAYLNPDSAMENLRREMGEARSDVPLERAK